MKRVHVFEFEDARWFPDWIRRSMTNVLVALSRLMGATDALAVLVARVLEEQKLDQVVDLGSGAGGVMPTVIERVRQGEVTARARLLMTDLYPSADAMARFGTDRVSPVCYAAESVDATTLESAPPGLKTMVNSFHHMRPDQARQVLSSASASRQPLLIYELGENKLPFVLWCLALPVALPLVALTCLFLTPLARPLSARQLVFTYLVPVIPLFYAWDGQASMPRLYAFEDFDELLAGLERPDYVWEKGPAKDLKGASRGMYVLGRPRDRGSADPARGDVSSAIAE